MRGYEAVYCIAIDAMGGDHAPDITVAGSLEALQTYPDLRLLLVGSVEQIKPLLCDAGQWMDRIELVEAPDVITNHESPVAAIRHKTQSSLVRAIDLVREGRAQALVSAGSTGAVMAGGMFRLGRIEGIERPALAVLIPTIDQPALLIDIGANVDCLPAYLSQFALMGSIYMEKVLDRACPRVALVNIGEEAEKGNAQTKAAHALMASNQPYHFTGNVEARGISMGEADVAVCDGFTGNIVLKTMEGITKALFKLLKRELMANTRGKLGALLGKSAFQRIKHRMDADEVGGALLLGVEGAVVKAHGSSNGHAYFCAIRQAYQMLERNIVEIIRDEVSHLVAEAPES